MAEKSLGELVGLFNSNLSNLDAFVNPSSQHVFQSLNDTLANQSQEVHFLSFIA